MKIDNMTIKQIEARLKSMDGWEYRRCLNIPYEKKLKKLTSGSGSTSGSDDGYPLHGRDVEYWAGACRYALANGILGGGATSCSDLDMARVSAANGDPSQLNSLMMLIDYKWNNLDL